jgi:hypothetical protein
VISLARAGANLPRPLIARSAADFTGAWRAIFAGGKSSRGAKRALAVTTKFHAPPIRTVRSLPTFFHLLPPPSLTSSLSPLSRLAYTAPVCLASVSVSALPPYSSLPTHRSESTSSAIANVIQLCPPEFEHRLSLANGRCIVRERIDLSNPLSL